MAGIKVVEGDFEERAQPRHARMIVRADSEIKVIATWFCVWSGNRLVAIHTYESESDEGFNIEFFDNLDRLANNILQLARAYVEEGAEVEIRVVGDTELYKLLKAKAAA